MVTPIFSDRFVGIEDVLEITAIKSKSTIYSLVNGGKFPKPYPITEARRAWSFSEIQDWIEERKAAA